MGTKRISEEDRIIEQMGETLTEVLSKRAERARFDNSDPHRIIVEEDIRALLGRYEKLAESLSDYRRPNGRINGLFSRMLAPLPSGMKDIEFDDDARRQLKTLPTYRWTALGLLLGAVASILTLSKLFPWLLVSPLSIFMDSASVSSGTQSTVISVVTVTFGIILLATGLLSWRGLRDFVHSAALSEEKWFRSGAENWSWSQRAVSCVAFGACHILNIIYPLVTLMVLSAAGAVFMWAYLREYRSSQDVIRATLASTRLHAMYNIYAGCFLIVAVVLMVASPLL